MATVFVQRVAVEIDPEPRIADAATAAMTHVDELRRARTGTEKA
jgi:hypothetical protein